MNTICSLRFLGLHKVTRMNQDYTPKISSAVILPLTWLVQPGALLEAGFKGTVCKKWPHFNSILQTNMGQHITKESANCC